MPVGYEPGPRYPLVIQTHGFSSTEFLTDGAFTTAMAARPLASAGIMVLQVQTNYSHQMKEQEQADNVLGYESAIDQLVKEGLVDRSRVGIVGFSRTSWYVESALVKDTNRYAAASINDGVDQGYMQAMLFDPGRSNSEGQSIYGAAEFGDGINKWVQLAPDFHLDKVRTPLMITAITRPSALVEWELYSALYQQNKPVDLICISDGQHILQKPKDRLASQQGNVDWFRFWLQGYEDPDTAKKAQYERWEHLRVLQNAEN
jgi:dipeptidyl aminopeptidase/acylaminoacyl peptidase